MDAHNIRTGPDGRRQEIRRRLGDAAWRGASRHEIEDIGEAHELIVVGLK